MPKLQSERRMTFRVQITLFGKEEVAEAVRLALAPVTDVKPYRLPGLVFVLKKKKKPFCMVDYFFFSHVYLVIQHPVHYIITVKPTSVSI